jgi:hypothetical protein
VARLADEHAVTRPHDLDGLVEHRLHEPRILAVLGRERAGPLSGVDLVERPHPALGLRDDLVRHDEHVAVGEVGWSGVRQERDEVVAGPDVRERGERASEEGHSAEG